MNKNGSKWKTMPQKMFMYRAAGWLIDTTAPEIAMGIPAADQVEDFIDINPTTGEVLNKVEDDIEAALTGNAATEQEDAPANDTTPPMEIVLSGIKGAESGDDLDEVEALVADWDKRTAAYKQVAQAIDNKRAALEAGNE